MSLDPVTNFAKCTVSTGYDASATSIVLSAGQGALLPDPSASGAFNLVWWDSSSYSDPSDDPNKEVVRVTSRITDTLTAIRAQEGTSASTKNTAGKMYKMILSPTKKMIDDIRTFIDSFVFNETPSGTINGVNVTFVLAHTPASGSLRVRVDGACMRPTGDYSLSVATITMTIAPTQWIECDYIKA